METNEFASLARQYSEIVSRVAQGTLDSADVRAEFQAIMEGRFFPNESPVAATGAWAVSPRNQIARLLKLSDQMGWGLTRKDIPKVPKFKPSTATERLLLAVYFEPKDGLSSELVTFNRWTDAVPLLEGHEKLVWPYMEIDEQHMRVVTIASKPGVRWVAFDPHAYWAPESGRRVSDLWGNLQVAPTLSSTESIMALAYDPTWAPRWNGKEVPYPDLAGWQYSPEGNDRWQDVPYLVHWDDDSQVRLGVSDAGELDQDWSAPTVRELH